MTEKLLTGTLSLNTNKQTIQKTKVYGDGYSGESLVEKIGGGEH